MPDAELAWTRCPWCDLDPVIAFAGALASHSKDATYEDVAVAAVLGISAVDVLMCPGSGMPVETAEATDA